MKLLYDIALVAGAGLMVYGLGLWATPLGVVAAGAALVWFAIRGGLTQ